MKGGKGTKLSSFSPFLPIARNESCVSSEERREGRLEHREFLRSESWLMGGVRGGRGREARTRGRSKVKAKEKVVALFLSTASLPLVQRQLLIMLATSQRGSGGVRKG